MPPSISSTSWQWRTAPRSNRWARSCPLFRCCCANAPMSEALRCQVLADFNGANLAAYLSAADTRPLIEAEAHMLAGVAAAGPTIDGHAVAVVWTQPDRASQAMAEALNGHAPDAARAVVEVDAFAESVRALSTRVSTVLVVSWVLPPYHRAFG